MDKENNFSQFEQILTTRQFSLEKFLELKDHIYEPPNSLAPKSLLHQKIIVKIMHQSRLSGNFIDKGVNNCLYITQVE